MSEEWPLLFPFTHAWKVTNRTEDFGDYERSLGPFSFPFFSFLFLFGKTSLAVCSPRPRKRSQRRRGVSCLFGRTGKEGYSTSLFEYNFSEDRHCTTNPTKQNKTRTKEERSPPEPKPAHSAGVQDVVRKGRRGRESS